MPERKAGRVEAITHEEARRSNIPTSELQATMPDERKKPVKVAYEKRNPDLDPQLIWRGKYDGPDTLTVNTPPLYIQEKIHPKALIEDLRIAGKGGDLAEEIAQYQCNLFADFNGFAKDADKTDFYQHDQNWTNRMILGDSLQVMASLAEREGLRGQVQAIYLDPPYGIRFNSNFQWSTNSRNQTDGKDFTREPEQVKAFRDTWEDGIHSYLGYLRDRFIVARDLLTDSGSIFVQIGDENVHLVRMLMDEVFGSDNYYAQISVSTTTGLGGDRLAKSTNYILWYAKRKEEIKYRPILRKKAYGQGGSSSYNMLELENGERLTINEYENRSGLPFAPGQSNHRIFTLDNITSANHGQGVGKTGFNEYIFNGKKYYPGKRSFTTHKMGMDRLAKSSRLDVTEKRMGYVRNRLHSLFNKICK